MDDIKIRDYIINNFKDDDTDTIKRAIVESIEEQDEVTLPGMGVFFEIISCILLLSFRTKINTTSRININKNK